MPLTMTDKDEKRMREHVGMCECNSYVDDPHAAKTAVRDRRLLLAELDACRARLAAAEAAARPGSAQRTEGEAI